MKGQYLCKNTRKRIGCHMQATNATIKSSFCAVISEPLALVEHTENRKDSDQTTDAHHDAANVCLWLSGPILIYGKCSKIFLPNFFFFFVR